MPIPNYALREDCHVRIGTAFAITLFMLASCGPEAPTFELQEVEFSAGGESGEPNLAVMRDGRAILTWLEPTGDGGTHALRLSVRSNGRWSDPRTVVASEHFFVNWADFPSFVELGDRSWAVHWLEKVGASTYAYHIRLAVSKDDGETWSAPITPHRDMSPTEHGFVSMVAWESGATLVWLDGRDMVEGVGEADDEMSLRATTLTPAGEIGPDLLLDDRTCECCQTALVATATGLVAAYRDRSIEEIRDIAVVRHTDGGWTQPTIVSPDAFHYPGCPVNGPQLAARGDTVAIAWYTAPDQRARVHVAFSFDGAQTFESPIQVDHGDPLGRVDIELLPDGSAVVVWVERTPESAEIRARRVTPIGKMDSSWLVSETAASRGSGFPRMAVTDHELIISWRLLGPDGGVRVAAARWRE
jgi:hypothetical protein